jgi:hypothetical protein
MMRRTVLTLLVFLGGAGIYHFVNRTAHHDPPVQNVIERNDVLPDVEDFLGERFPLHPLHLEPLPTLCAAEENSASALVQMGCGGGRSGPVQMALHSRSSSVRNGRQ